jgi:hypothetical protein
MNRGSGIKGRDDRSSGIEMRMTDALAKINLTDPLKLARQASRRFHAAPIPEHGNQVYLQQNKKKAKAEHGRSIFFSIKNLFFPKNTRERSFSFRMYSFAGHLEPSRTDFGCIRIPQALSSLLLLCPQQTHCAQQPPLLCC